MFELPSQIGAEAAAAMTGSFLAGAMMDISMLTIPVLLESTTGPAELVDHWACLYDHGHRIMPAFSITTCLLYAWASVRKARAGKPWRVYALAGLTTFAMVPFTWFVMKPINSTLAAAQIESHAGRGLGWETAVGLLTRWTILHTTRALFPLTGAVMGWMGTLKQF